MAKKRRRWLSLEVQEKQMREREKKRRGDLARRTKRETGARQGRTGAVRWHKKRRSEKRKKSEERTAVAKGKREWR